jgi:hypothetical protein
MFRTVMAYFSCILLFPIAFGTGYFKYPPTKRKTLKFYGNPLRIQSVVIFGRYYL